MVDHKTETDEEELQDGGQLQEGQCHGTAAGGRGRRDVALRIRRATGYRSRQHYAYTAVEGLPPNSRRPTGPLRTLISQVLGLSSPKPTYIRTLTKSDYETECNHD